MLLDSPISVLNCFISALIRVFTAGIRCAIVVI